MNVIVGAFLQTMRNSSVFLRLLDSMVRVPFRSRISLVATDATSWTVGEGKPIPVTNATLDQLLLTPQKAAALLVVTEELLRGTQSERNLTLALRRALAAAVDLRFLSTAIGAGTPTFPSVGPTAADAVADVKQLLDAVQPTSESSLMFVTAPDVQRAGATITNASGAFQFPNLTPTGGEILGIPAMPSDQMIDGTMALIDATRIAGETGTIQVDASDQATIEMLDSALVQDATTGTPAPGLVSMFQANSVAIRALLDFDAQVVRENAVAQVTGIAWA
ncbi:phage major capsid protein, partial [Rhizobium sp. SEMIA 4085]